MCRKCNVPRRRSFSFLDCASFHTFLRWKYRPPTLPLGRRIFDDWAGTPKIKNAFSAFHLLIQDVRNHLFDEAVSKFTISEYITHIIILNVEVLILLVYGLILDGSLVMRVYSISRSFAVSSHICDEEADLDGFRSCWVRRDLFSLTSRQYRHVLPLGAPGSLVRHLS